MNHKSVSVNQREMKINNHIGETFGYWVVVGNGTRFVLARCACGQIKNLRYRDLIKGFSKSCGCKKSEFLALNRTTHGDSRVGNRSRIYSIWACMLTRSRNENIKKARNYSGRGIGVCDEWLKYESFKDWSLNNGYSDELSIDRIDNDLGYSPENCRWATAITQANNKSRTKYVFLNGEKIPRAEFARMFGFKYSSVRLLQEADVCGEEIIDLLSQ
jgi:hypothetical protein